MKHLVIFAAALFLACGQSWGTLRLPEVITDNMVLQQGKKVCIWGECDPGAKVRLSFRGQKKTAEADYIGRWSIVLDEMEASATPADMTIRCGKEKVILKNILTGEVWLASGQSNMEYSMNNHPKHPKPKKGDREYLYKAFTSADNPLIRVLHVRKELKSPLPTDGWEILSQESLAPVSAAAYFFADSLSRCLDVPVGIISSSWGGTPIEQWTSVETYENSEIFGDRVGYNRIDGVDIAKRYDYMIAPIAPYTIRGFLWYQGESNRDNPEMYARQMPAMVAKWRKLWNDDTMPFYFAQIAHFNYKDINGDVVPEFVNMQQSLVGEIPYSGIVGTTDIGELACIHPAAKDKVGFRFAHMALNECYGRYGDSGIPSTGPTFTKIEKAKNGILVYFDQTLAPVLDGVLGFEVEYKDGSSAKVAAKVSAKSDAVLLSVPRSDEAVAVKYAYRNYIESNLLNIYGLPAFPFRTEIE